jgi:flagellar biosynthesis anti-sigma factor FlgM
MRISEIIASLIPKVRPIGPSSGTSGVEKTSGIHSRPDEVQLSGEGQLLSRLNAELKALPEVDEARVAELKSMIESGEYTPSDESIAAKILGFEE